MKPLKPPKPLKKHVEAHSSSAKTGSGDYYGVGLKNPVGRLRDSYMIDKPVTKNIGKPPKSMA